MSINDASSQSFSYLSDTVGGDGHSVHQIHAVSTNVDNDAEALTPADEPAPFDKFAYVKERILYSGRHLTYRERIVLLVLWSHTSANGRSAYPTRATIALAAGIGKGKHGEVDESDLKKVTGILKTLREKGYIRMTKNRSSTGKKSNIYALVM